MNRLHQLKSALPFCALVIAVAIAVSCQLCSATAFADEGGRVLQAASVSQESGISDAKPVSLGSTFSDSFSQADGNTTAFYSFEVNEAGPYACKPYGGGVTTIGLYDETGILLKSSSALYLDMGSLAKGTYYIGLTGQGSFSGSVYKKLVAASVSNIKPVTYSGAAKSPTPTVTWNGRKLVKGVEYGYNYWNNVNAGTATVNIYGLGEFEGSPETLTKKFKITKANISKAKISKIGIQKYKKSGAKPKPTVKFKGETLEAGKDYRLSYSRNRAEGKAKVTIKGKGNYKGSKTASFRICNHHYVYDNSYASKCKLRALKYKRQANSYQLRSIEYRNMASRSFGTRYVNYMLQASSCLKRANECLKQSIAWNKKSLNAYACSKCGTAK